ncbi:MAG: STAS domain-containing protein [Lachnospiraceae bacterium]|nr:STAS domain-containing protein [Lachnospiraceae bacterium]MDY4069588.1 STAS domain-containing protein [Lachnospiraceae bacterium]
MNIAETRTEGKIQLTIEGRIDTTTCAQLQSAILIAFQKTNSLILDFQSVDYISSAGLRALLIGQKTASSKGGSMHLIHVQESVMQVLRMSGFSGILNID